MKNKKTFWIGFGAGFFTLLFCTGLYFFSGIFNISTSSSYPLINSIMIIIKERSLAVHASGIKLSVKRNDESITKGANEYLTSCINCHGGVPGYARLNYLKTLEPEAPDLSKKEFQSKFSDKEIFWIIKNGIRMTGMTAFGKISTDLEIEDHLIFVRELPNFKNEDDFKKYYK